MVDAMKGRDEITEYALSWHEAAKVSADCASQFDRGYMAAMLTVLPDILGDPYLKAQFRETLHALSGSKGARGDA